MAKALLADSLSAAAKKYDLVVLALQDGVKELKPFAMGVQLFWKERSGFGASCEQASVKFSEAVADALSSLQSDPWAALGDWHMEGLYMRAFVPNRILKDSDREIETNYYQTKGGIREQLVVHGKNVLNFLDVHLPTRLADSSQILHDLVLQKTD